jgi:hypothetical protein
MKGLKQSTSATVLVGPVLDSTGAAVTNAVVGDFRLAKNGTVATLSGATVTHDANGYYLIALTTGNTDTTGRLVLTSGNTAHSMASHHWSVLPASVFDAIYTNATNSTGGLATATGSITALAGAVSTLTAPQVRTELATELGRIDQTISSRATQTSVDAIDDFVDTEVAAIKAKTDLIVAFPDNFGSLGIDPSGAINDVLYVYELDAGALSANQAADPIAGVVWNALTTTTWANNSFGKHVLISNNNNRSVQVTGSGSGHVAADIHALQAGVVTSAAFSANWLTAAGLAADAATKIATAVAATQALSRLDSMIESDGAGQFRFDTIALEMAPAGGGGGGTDWTANERTAIRSILGIPTSGTTPTDPAVGILDEIRDDINAIGINVYPVSASTPERVAGTTLTFYRNESRSVSVVTDFTLTSLTLQFTVEDADGVDVYTLANGSISRSSQTFTVAVTTAVTGNLGQYRWSMRDISGGGSSVIAMGVLTVQEAASNV